MYLSLKSIIYTITYALLTLNKINNIYNFAIKYTITYALLIYYHLIKLIIFLK